MEVYDHPLRSEFSKQSYYTGYFIVEINLYFCSNEKTRK